MSLARVEKRDGRQVPFDESKIAAAIARAMDAVGEPDDGFAGEVAGVVRLTLEERHGAGSVPSIEEIQDLVEQALIELGRSRAAKAYILYRDQRARARAALAERTPAGRRGVPRVQVREAEGSSPWSKGRIVAALMREADLTREVSDKVAAQVEQRVFQAGLPQVTTALVRELVEAELLSMGLERARRRQTTFGLPAFDLRQLIDARPPSFPAGRPVPAELLQSARVERAVSGDVLGRFALEELLGERGGGRQAGGDELALRHRSGDLHVHELGAPHRPLWISLSAGTLASRPTADGAFELLGELAALAGEVAHGVALEDPLPVLAPLAQGRGLGLAAWLRALTAVARGALRRIELSAPGLRSPSLLERLVRELAALEDDAFAPRLFVDERELALLAGAAAPVPGGARGTRGSGTGAGAGAGQREEALGAALDRLLSTGRLVPTWNSEGERLVAPGCHRAAGERAAITCGAAVSINLPRIALRAGPWREDRLLELLSEAVDDAVRAVLALFAFRRGARSLRGRVGAAVAPVGLCEALKITGDGAVDAELGARVLGFLADALERAERVHRLRMVPSACFGVAPAARFAELDLKLPQRGQRLLFDPGPDGRPAGGEPYAHGYRITSPARALGAALDGWPLEARLVSTVPVGALAPLPIGPEPWPLHWPGAGAPAWAGGAFPGGPAGEGRESGVARAVLACFEQRADPAGLTTRRGDPEPALAPAPALFPDSAPASTERSS